MMSSDSVRLAKHGCWTPGRVAKDNMLLATGDVIGLFCGCDVINCNCCTDEDDADEQFKGLKLDELQLPKETLVAAVVAAAAAAAAPVFW